MSNSGSKLIRFVNGRPTMLHNGRPVSQVQLCDYIVWDDWEHRVQEFIDMGVKVFSVRMNAYDKSELWDDPPSEQQRKHQHRVCLLDQVKYILDNQPEALLLIRTMSGPSPYWGETHPDHMQTDEKNELDSKGDASLSSDQYVQDVCAFLKRTVDFCESQPWADRIVGYFDSGPGEGHAWLAVTGNMFDSSPVNQKAFNAWVRNKYSTDADLQSAWQDSQVTLETARVPRDSEWIAKRASGSPSLGGEPFSKIEEALETNASQKGRGLFHWVESADARKELDYCYFQREMCLRKFKSMSKAIKDACAERGVERIVGFDMAKQQMMGWQILSAFDGIGDGYSFPDMLAVSGSWDLGELLDDENLDVIWTPADYTARSMGFAYDAEGVTDSLAIRGKLMMLENDARVYTETGEGSNNMQGQFRNDVETEAGLLRNFALTLSRGMQSYWCIPGGFTYKAPGVQKVFRETMVPLMDRLKDLPHRETRDAIAFVIDDSSSMHEDFTSGYQNIAVIWQRVLGLAHCGVPYRIFLLSDLKNENLTNFKTWVFPNLFKVDDEVLALLKSKVLRDGNVAIFGPGTGITDGDILSADGATRLLNVPMELIPRTTCRRVIIQDSGHPITRELRASQTYGDSLTYGPVIAPKEWAVENAGGAPLGHASASWFINNTGLFIKEEGLGAAGNGCDGERGPDDYAVLWSIAMPMPANLLRSAARYAGSNIWCEQDDVIYASDTVVSLHSVKAGKRTIKLPRPAAVTNAVTQEKLGDGLTEITVEVNPPATFIFTLE